MSGARRSIQTSATASTVMVTRSVRRVFRPAPARYSQMMSRPNDSASSSSGGADRDHPDEAAEHSGCGDGEHDALDRGHDLAPVLGGSGAASHGISQPASSNTYRAAPMASTQLP